MSNTIDFGIDLGTTNSAIAKFIKGKVEVFKNPTTWKDTTASVVGFRKDSILVGERARTYQKMWLVSSNVKWGPPKVFE
jgi:molecular chaperone DnaK